MDHVETLLVSDIIFFLYSETSKNGLSGGVIFIPIVQETCKLPVF
jgi:hypothetical protein